MPQRIFIRDQGRSCWLGFERPLCVVEAHSIADVLPVLVSIENRVRDEGLFAAGYVSYEAAPGFDPALKTRRQTEWPLLSFGLFETADRLDRIDEPDVTDKLPETWRTATSKAEYLRNIGKIKEQIELGNTYQINYTIRAKASLPTDPWELFRRLSADAPYGAYLESGDYAIVSASPELFFSLEGGHLLSRPMKGTAKRGMTTRDDRRLRDQLQASAKDRAENVMIADMIRNDLGRVADAGTVIARDMYRIEKYPTVWQMTSTIAAQTGATVAEIFAALFPCASVTGAPKVASMNLIAGLESSPRHIYTGAIGFMAPRRKAQFSVAIRTAFVDRKQKAAVYGIGGGIVWNSKADDEYEECLIKARILDPRPSPEQFHLLETLLWSGDDEIFLLDRHLARMRASAEYFDFRFDEQAARRALNDRVSSLEAGRFRLRLLLSSDGVFQTTASAADVVSDSGQTTVRLAAQAVDTNDPFLYHKTTWRRGYERALRDAGECDDVLLWNGDGHITETTIANVVVRIDGRLYTPPVDCGLLAGTYREWLLEQGAIEERRIHFSELTHGAGIVLLNSVRGQYRGRFVSDESDVRLREGDIRG